MKRKRSIKVTLLAVVMLAALLAPSMGVNADEPSWEALSPMPNAKTAFQTEVVDGKIYVIGGNGSKTVEVYDPNTNAWTELSSMSTGRIAFKTEVIDGKIYAVGGYTSSTVYLSSAEVYDPATDSWTAIASMSTARGSFQTVVVGGRIYAIGGSNGYLLDSTEVYDPNTNTWTTLSSMSKARYHFQAETLNGKIYIFCEPGNDGVLMEVYDPDTDTWSSLASMSVEHYEPVTGVVGGKLYVMGGFRTAAAEVYDPDTDTWTTLTSMPFEKAFAGKGIIDGKIYVVGGKDQDEGIQLASTEVYDPDTDTWTTLSPMVLARQNVQTEVINGSIYALGGSYDGVALPLVERYTVTSSSSGVPASPTNLTATAGDAQVDLSWDAVTGADSYTLMRAEVSGGPYTAIATGLTGTSYTDTDVTNGTAYYYVVIAVNDDGESEYSNEASGTPTAAAPTYSALLRVTMVTGETKEYQMDSADIAAFIAWCQSEGAGSPAYRIVKDYNIGPFSAREEYLIYDKIVSYEVLQYD